MRARGVLRFAAAAILCGALAAPVAAKPEFLEVFQKTYPPRPNTPLADAACGSCHAASGAPKRNPYGSAVQQALRASAAKTLTAPILRRIESADPDGDGSSSRNEIAAGTLPGAADSHPAKALPPVPAKPPVPAPPAPSPAQKSQTWLERLVPAHSFHPTVVHFPIALFLFGGICELLGVWKRRDLLRAAGALNMTAASVASLAAVGTGFLALWRGGFALEGTALLHLCLAVAATAGMGATALVGWRFTQLHERRASRTYWALLAASLLLVGVAGHFGGELVYGR